MCTSARVSTHTHTQPWLPYMNATDCENVYLLVSGIFGYFKPGKVPVVSVRVSVRVDVGVTISACQKYWRVRVAAIDIDQD